MQHVPVVYFAPVVVVGVQLLLLQTVYMMVNDGAGRKDEGIYGCPFLPGCFNIFCLFFRQSQPWAEQQDCIVFLQRRCVFRLDLADLYQAAVACHRYVRHLVGWEVYQCYSGGRKQQAIKSI